MEYTRKDCLNGKCTHHEYYSQFVNDAVINMVKLHIGVDKIKKSTDKHFNDIPLGNWDMVRVDNVMDLEKWRTLACPNYLGSNNYYYTKSDNVCIAKAAARIIKETY